MNEKGFTLSELLAVVVILSVIVVMAAPAISREIKQGEEETQNITNEKIENAAHLFVGKYYSSVVVRDCSANCTISFSLTELEQDGLIELKDEVCKKVREANIIVNYEGKNVEYNYDAVKADDCYVKKQTD